MRKIKRASIMVGFIVLSHVMFPLISCHKTEDSPPPKKQYTEIDPGILGEIRKNISLLKSENPEERQNACILFWQLGPLAAEAVHPLIEALNDPVPEVRNAVVFTLGEMYDKARSALPALKKMQNKA